MIKIKGNSQTQAGTLAMPMSQKDTGNPMANAAVLAWEKPLCQAAAAAKTPPHVANIMATEGSMPCSTKNR
jgi:hypothetical protein